MSYEVLQVGIAEVLRYVFQNDSCYIPYLLYLLYLYL